MSRKKDVTPAAGARERRTKNSNSAPKKVADMLAGHVEARMVKCGKKGCKCSRGELHGPYFYHRTWDGKGHHKSYVRLSDVPQTRQACAAHQSLQARLREGRKAYKALLARAREVFR